MVLQKLKMNKKGLEFKSAFFAIIAFSMFIIALGIIIDSYNEGYNMDVTNDLSSYDKLDEVSSQATGQKSAIGANDPEPSEDAEANTYRGVYGVLVNIFSSFDLVFGSNGMLQSISNRFGIDAWIVQGIIAFMMIAITFSLVAIIFRLTRSSA